MESTEYVFIFYYSFTVSVGDQLFVNKREWNTEQKQFVTWLCVAEARAK